MFWTLASGVPIWTCYEMLLLWAYSNGYATIISPVENPMTFTLIFLLVPFVHEVGFYFAHRFLHWPPLYRIAHQVHHRNTNPGPWSGLSMHPIEHVIYFSSVLIFFVIPAHTPCIWSISYLGLGLLQRRDIRDSTGLWQARKHLLIGLITHIIYIINISK